MSGVTRNFTFFTFQKSYFGNYTYNTLAYTNSHTHKYTSKYLHTHPKVHTTQSHIVYNIYPQYTYHTYMHKQHTQNTHNVHETPTHNVLTHSTHVTHVHGSWTVHKMIHESFVNSVRPFRVKDGGTSSDTFECPLNS